MSDPYEIGWLFADLNAFFASVEQELRPELRGQPIGIVPIEAETACCIAASYQAKAYGIKTGLRLDEALLLCPHLIVVQARPRLYVGYHHLIVAAIERCIPVQAVMSCDEFACQLMGRERHLRRAVEIAYSNKAELRTVGSTLRCSIGLAPNRLLAKIAGDMTKPDGLMIFELRHLPRALYGLKLGRHPRHRRSDGRAHPSRGHHDHARIVCAAARTDARDMGERVGRPALALVPWG
jgi:DNA polymerase-4